DKGLADEANGVQLMKPMPNLESLLGRANERGITATKMRSNVLEPNEQGIKEVADQQFEVGRQIIAAELVPIIEPEVNVYSDNKDESVEIPQNEIQLHPDQLSDHHNVMLQLPDPPLVNLDVSLVQHPRLVRDFSQSGGYPAEVANLKLKDN